MTNFLFLCRHFPLDVNDIFFVLDTCENRKCIPLVHGLVPYPVVPQLHAVLELLIAHSEHGLSTEIFLLIILKTGPVSISTSHHVLLK